MNPRFKAYSKKWTQENEATAQHPNAQAKLPKSSPVKSPKADDQAKKKIITSVSVPKRTFHDIDDSDLSFDDASKTVKRVKSEKKVSGHISRPMNVFMIFSKRHRQFAAENYPHWDNRARSGVISDWWYLLPDQTKLLYNQLADDIASAYKKRFPDSRRSGTEQCSKEAMQTIYQEVNFEQRMEALPLYDLNNALKLNFDPNKPLSLTSSQIEAFIRSFRKIQQHERYMEAFTEAANIDDQPHQNTGTRNIIDHQRRLIMQLFGQTCLFPSNDAISNFQKEHTESFSDVKGLQRKIREIRQKYMSDKAAEPTVEAIDMTQH